MEKTFITSSSGAFKTVEVYTNYVIKKAKNTYVEPECITYDEARLMSQFFDEDGIFQPDWVDDYNYDENRISGGSEEECYDEMEREYNFMMKFGHLPIFMPILWGDEQEYAMARAKTFDDFWETKISVQEKQRKSKLILVGVAAKFNRVGIPASKYKLSGSRLNNVIDLGLKAKLPIDRIIDDAYLFVYFDATRYLLDDMHKGNLGIYRGHIVAFDVGQATVEPQRSIRHNMNTKTNHNFYWKRKSQIQARPY